jgi:hypothetical protein
MRIERQHEILQGFGKPTAARCAVRVPLAPVEGCGGRGPDLSRLLQNSIRWVLRGDSPVQVDGKGVIETFRLGTEPGYAVQVLHIPEVLD